MDDQGPHSEEDGGKDISGDDLYPDDQPPSLSHASWFWPDAAFRFVMPAKKFLGMISNKTRGLPTALSTLEQARISAMKIFLEEFSSMSGELFVKVEPKSLPPKLALLVNHLIEAGVMTELKAFPLYHDEPQFFLYSARYDLEGKTGGSIDAYIKKQMVGKGADFEPKIAVLKAISEAIERSTFATYRRADLKFAKPSELRGEVLYPSKFRYFLPQQLARPRFAGFRCGDDMSYGWVKGMDWFRNKPVWIPAQIIYWNYSFHDEPRIWNPITSGAAAGLSFYQAFANAILELIERDGFLIRWIHQMTPRRIDCDRLLKEQLLDTDLRHVLESLRFCGLELHLLDTRLDFDIPTVASVIIDRSGILPTVSVGGACHPDWQKAIKKSLLECMMMKYAIRNMIKRDRKAGRQITGIRSAAYETPMDREERFRFWAQPEAVEYIRPFLDGEKFCPDIEKQNAYMASVDLVGLLSKKLKQNKCSLYVYEAPLPKNLRHLGFWAVRAISPEMMPLYFHEQFPYLGALRLADVPKKLGHSSREGLNPFPHPYP